MSKRPCPSGISTRRRPTTAPDAVEIINLLDDSSGSEDDPDDAAMQLVLNAAARPTKRLRQMNASSLQGQRSRATAATTDPIIASCVYTPATQTGIRCRQATEDPPPFQRPVPKAKRHGTLPVATLQLRTATLPLQTLNVNLTHAGIGNTTCTDSSDSVLPGLAAGTNDEASRCGVSRAPSASPSASQRSAPMLHDPYDFQSLSPLQSQPQLQGSASQLTSSQHQQQKQSVRLQLRQLTFAPPRTASTATATTAAACGGRGVIGLAPGHAVAAAVTERIGDAGAATDNRVAKQRLGCLSGPTTVGSAPCGSAPPRPASASPAAASPPSKMWHERHAPRSEEDLVQVLHRKKISEMKDWLERQHQLLTIHGSSSMTQLHRSISTHPQQENHLCLKQHGQHGAVWQQQQQCWPASDGGGGYGLGLSGQPRFPCGLAVLSGPSGCGKSTCLRILAAAAGFEVVEWTPPPPVMWNEYQTQRSAAGDREYGSDPPASYQSKLDDFESFVSRSKYPALALIAAASSPSVSWVAGSEGGPERGARTSGRAQRPKLLLVEDLPHTHDAERRQRLAAALQDLVATARVPVVLLVTEVEGQTGGGGGRGGNGFDDSGSMGGAKGLHKDLLAAVKATGATTISFNPVTANNIAKLLLRVAAAEGLDLTPAVAVGLAEAADGDVRSALQALQMNSLLITATLRGAATTASGKKGAGGNGKKRGGGKKGGTSASVTAQLRAGRQAALMPGELTRLSAAQRDKGLPLFHALGKFLHNKRGAAAPGDGDSDCDDDVGCGSIDKDKWEKDSVALRQLNAHSLTAGQPWKLRHLVQLPARLLRPPMRYDPEAILLRCGLEAPALLSFLHENYLGFVDGTTKESVDDVAMVAAYLSDSAVLCGQSRAASATAATAGGRSSLWLEDSPAAANLSSAIAASVAARGLMYGNTHPTTHCFNPIRAPASYAIDQAAAANQMQLHAAVAASCGGSAAAAAGVGGSAGSGALSAAAAAAFALFGGSSVAQLVSTVMPWLRSLVQWSPHHALWLVPLLPGSWSYFWNGAVIEGAYLRHVAALPPTQGSQQEPHQQQRSVGWQGGAGANGAVEVTEEGRREQLDLEDEDPIED